MLTEAWESSLSFLSFPRLLDLAESLPPPLSLERVPHTYYCSSVSSPPLSSLSNQMGKSLEKEEGEKMGQHNGKKSYRMATMLFSWLDTFPPVWNFHIRNVGNVFPCVHTFPRSLFPFLDKKTAR